jgi:hypothetical protein
VNAPAGTATVSATIDEGAALVIRARQLVDAITETDASLGRAAEALTALVADTRTDLDEARIARDAAPDADTGAAVIAAMSDVDAALDLVEAADRVADPIADVELLGHAVESLDLALAGARNQTQRLEHARSALVGALIGALIGAKSQIAVARDAMAGGRSGVDARTRLAEAERQLMLAESESDPVEALDAARRATTAARDAEALANYAAL